VVLAPEVVHWALLRLAAALALDVIKDLVAAAHLGSADARTNALIVKLVHFAEVRYGQALTLGHVPVVLIRVARLRHTETSAVISAPESIGGANLLVTHTLSDLEVPEMGGVTVLRVLSAQTRTISVNVPEVANCAHLRVLFTTT